MDAKMSEYTPEPWHVESGSAYAEKNGEAVPIVHADRNIGNGTTPVERDENIKRIVLCVNVLAGIPSVNLEAIIAVHTQNPLQSALAGMIEEMDRWDDITYTEDNYPAWFLNLAGGLDNLDVASKESGEIDDA